MRAVERSGLVSLSQTHTQVHIYIYVRVCVYLFLCAFTWDSFITLDLFSSDYFHVRIFHTILISCVNNVSSLLKRKHTHKLNIAIYIIFYAEILPKDLAYIMASEIFGIRVIGTYIDLLVAVQK